MYAHVKHIIQLMRPQQWAKNLFIFLPLFFNANVNNFHQLALCLYAFIGFSFVASGIYCINDIIDVKEDQKHPKKSKRPVASGKISMRRAIGIAMCLFCAGISVLFFSSLSLSVIIVTTLYLIMNLAYAFYLKQLAIIDIMCIASGFVLRVIVGGYAANVELSHWIILMTFLLATFLASAKRRDDVLFHLRGGVVARKNVINYNIEFLNALMIINATITIICYLMYTVDKEVIERFGEKRYIYSTAIFVMAAIARYLQIALVEENSGNPTGILLKDRFIQLCITGWIIVFAFIIYF